MPVSATEIATRSTIAPNRDAYASAVPVVFDRIGDEVVKDHVDFAAVGRHHHWLAVLDAKRDAARLRLGEQCLDGRRRGLAEIERHEFPLALARLDVRHVQQVGNQLPHALDPQAAAAGQRQIIVHVGPELPLFDHCQVALDGAERRLQFVPKHADELKADLPLLVGQPPGLLAENHPRRRLADRALKLAGRERLGQKVVRSLFRGRHRRLDRRIRGDHDRQHVELHAADPIEHVEPAHPRHLVVQQQDVGRIALDDFDGRLAAVHLFDGKSRLRRPCRAPGR